MIRHTPKHAAHLPQNQIVPQKLFPADGIHSGKATDYGTNSTWDKKWLQRKPNSVNHRRKKYHRRHDPKPKFNGDYGYWKSLIWTTDSWDFLTSDAKGYVIFPENSWFWVWKLNGVQTNYAYYFEDNHCRLTHSLLIPLYTKDSYCY